MRMKVRIANNELRMPPGCSASRPAGRSSFEIRHLKFALGFTLVEVMVVVVLLSLIVLALMAVFNSTQAAFRASVTQAGVLDDGRASMDLMADDLRAMTPSGGISNVVNGVVMCPVNFFAGVTSFASPPSPLVQPMVGGGSVRTNILQDFFVLSRGNRNGTPIWIGVGYAMATNTPSGSLYSLYRYYIQTNIQTNPGLLFSNFLVAVGNQQWAGMSHLMDGVVALTVRPYDINGAWMTANVVGLANGQLATNRNVLYFPSGPPSLGQVGFYLFSNTLPASVQIEMGVLEDRALQRAESLNGSATAQANYLSGRAGQVHVFRQRVSIPNVDPSAYQ